MAEVQLRSAEATALAHAMVAQVARDLGIRALAIKGPVSNHYALRAPRTSADTDVWVEPDGIAVLGEALRRRGWHLRVGRETPSLLPQHSSTYIHDRWPCDIDLHWTFPGFFGDSRVIFDALWDQHEILPIAHIDVEVPSRVGAAAIGLLHSLRDLRAARAATERRRIQEVIEHEFTDAERAEFYRLARLGGAVWVLREPIAEFGLGEMISDATADEMRRWTLYQNDVADASTVSWWALVKAAPLWKRPAVLLRAVWVPRADIPRNDPARTPTRAEAWKYQRARWSRGRKALLRHLRRGKDQRPA